MSLFPYRLNPLAFQVFLYIFFVESDQAANSVKTDLSFFHQIINGPSGEMQDLSRFLGFDQDRQFMFIHVFLRSFTLLWLLPITKGLHPM
jgi:hypothetical protein